MSTTPQEHMVIVPLDNRPVTYVLPQLITAVAGIQPLAPPRQFMGSLKTPTDTGKLNEWLTKALQQHKPKALFVCLDTFLYGGMVPWSRVSKDPLEEVLNRAKSIPQWKQLGASNLKVSAQASIMRIPDYDDATEEPPYWQEYGRKIFRWSALLHKQKAGSLSSEAELRASEAAIPQEMREDFLWRRNRNFKVNQTVLKYAQLGDIDYLVFSQDDTGEFGLNVYEKGELMSSAKEAKATNVVAYAGADEVMLSLITRWLAGTQATPPSVSLQFSPTGGEAVLSNYEGQTIGQSLRNQIAAAGLNLVDGSKSQDKIDFTVIAHTSGSKQGDHMWLPGHPDLRKVDTTEAVEQTLQLIKNSNVPCVLCDVAYSNGADPVLVDRLLQDKNLFSKLWAYAGWNTTGNTVGSALALGVASWYAAKHQLNTADALNQALFVRLADDWAYQTQVRSQLNNQASEAILNQLMKPHVQKLATFLNLKPEIAKLSFPWQRTFEVEVALTNKVGALI